MVPSFRMQPWPFGPNFSRPRRSFGRRADRLRLEGGVAAQLRVDGPVDPSAAAWLQRTSDGRNQKTLVLSGIGTKPILPGQHWNGGFGIKGRKKDNLPRG